MVQFEDLEGQYEFVHSEKDSTEVVAQGQQVPMENNFLNFRQV